MSMDKKKFIASRQFLFIKCNKLLHKLDDYGDPSTYG